MLLTQVVTFERVEAEQDVSRPPDTTQTAQQIQQTPQPPPGILRGTVIDVATGQPLAAARITVVGTAFVALTDASGSYRLAALPVGDTVTVRLQMIGYTSRDSTIVVGPDQNMLDFGLVPAVLSLDEIVVDPNVRPIFQWRYFLLLAGIFVGLEAVSRPSRRQKTLDESERPAAGARHRSRLKGAALGGLVSVVVITVVDWVLYGFGPLDLILSNLVGMFTALLTVSVALLVVRVDVAALVEDDIVYQAFARLALAAVVGAGTGFIGLLIDGGIGALLGQVALGDILSDPNFVAMAAVRGATIALWVGLRETLPVPFGVWTRAPGASAARLS